MGLGACSWLYDYFCLHAAFGGGSCLLITAVAKILAKLHFIMVSVFQVTLQNKLF